LLSALVFSGLAVAAGASHVNHIEVDGVISAATADFIQGAIDRSEAEQASALLIELDTPGGVLDPTKEIVQALLNAEIPVIVYVAPQGAWAASAGTFITLAAHVAAMAPGTSIGAASPVGGGTSEDRDEEGERTDVMGQKVENFTSAFIESIAQERDRNVEWAISAVREAEAIGAERALELGVIDVVARTRDMLFEKIEGREIEIAGEEQLLHVTGLPLRTIEMSPLEKVFAFIANPNVAVILMMGAVLGIMLEMNSPGIFVPGAVGLVCLVLAVFAFDLLPFSWLGLVLMAAGVALMVSELFVSALGLLFAAGVVVFLLGGAMLFEMPDVSDVSVSVWSVLVPASAGMIAFGAIVIFAIGRTFSRKQTAGVSELIGMLGSAVTALDPEGRVFVRGEYWTASGDEKISAGSPVEVIAVVGMRLRVRKAANVV
jgi:membrane-bound serine protease (ClpP class)